MIESERTCWDCFFKDQLSISARMSTCQTRHVGAVLAQGRRVVAAGFNGNLPGHLHCYDGGCPRCANTEGTGTNLDVCVCVHAETNAIAYCASNGISTSGCTLYVQCNPCLDCAKLAISSGIKEIVYLDVYANTYVMISNFCHKSGVTFRSFECSCV